ncbi:hypothetical protein [Nostoc commune]|uniref:hypothetical protein n=1 Tax=Nostoc commune TaxID=1178 RepID=UPI0015E80361|nr:hypothetical protein [Nostoc commune]
MFVLEYSDRKTLGIEVHPDSSVVVKPAFLTSGAIAITKPLSGLDFERFRHCTNHNNM